MSKFSPREAWMGNDCCSSQNKERENKRLTGQKCPGETHCFIQQNRVVCSGHSINIKVSQKTIKNLGMGKAGAGVEELIQLTIKTPQINHLENG